MNAANPVAPAAVPANSAPAMQTAARSERKPGGNHEGIQVHGHWVIEVRNPDGTVTARREFENAIQPSGMAYIASLLAGNNSPGGLSVLLNGATASLGVGAANQPGNNTYIYFPSTQTGPCLPMASSSGSGVSLSSGGSPTGTTCLLTPQSSNGVVSLLTAECLIFQENYSNSQTYPPTGQTRPCSTNLTVAAPTWMQNAASGSSVQIIGNVTVTSTSAGNVTDVETVFMTCDSSITTANCSLPFNANVTTVAGLTIFPDALSLLTERLLNGPAGTATAPVPYNPGQDISVTVTISFQ